MKVTSWWWYFMVCEVSCLRVPLFKDGWSSLLHRLALAPIFQPKTTESSHYKTHQSVHLLSFFPVIFQKSPLKQKFHPRHCWWNNWSLAHWKGLLYIHERRWLRLKHQCSDGVGALTLISLGFGFAKFSGKMQFQLHFEKK